MAKTGQKLVVAACGLVILTLLGPLGCRRGPSPSPELQSLLGADTLARQVGDPVIRSAVRAFYTRTGAELAWSRGAPTRQTVAALAVLAAARDHGLDPEAYQLSALTGERDALAHAADVHRGQSLAVFDVRLTAALLRLGRDVAVGRLSPRTLDTRSQAHRKLPELGGLLADCRDDVGQWLDKVQPRHGEYAALKQALAALRGVEAKGGWPAIRASVTARTPSGPAVVDLRRRLMASGDLAASDVGNKRFDATLARAVQVFQEHHGLPATGRVDARTLAALNVPLAWRIRQVTFNLERWRWMPDDLGERHFVVNIPQFHLLAYERGSLVMDIRAVVGKQGNETPLLSERMTHVVMSPYWNIPPRIAADETLPAVAADPGYLARQNIEVVRVSDGQPAVVDPASLDWADDAALESVRFRQRPGAGNALGLVKFMFPNEYDVYVHDTPADALFGRLGRAFSHGCVRVEEPLALAQYVLRDQPDWTREKISAAMHGGAETHVRLRQAIPIHITYFTSWVDTRGGLHFGDDVYGYDSKQAIAVDSRRGRAPSTPRRTDAKPNQAETERQVAPVAVPAVSGG